MKNRKPRADGRYSINISFTEFEVDLIRHVDSKGNFSSYVKYLIKRDMEGKTGQADLSILQELLKNNFQFSETKVHDEVHKKKKINKNAIKGLIVN